MSKWLTTLDYYLRKLTGRLSSESDLIAWFDAHPSLDSFAAGCASDFTYQSERWFDFARHPRAFLFEKGDDCDGFALFAEEWARYRGLEATRLYIRKSSSGHVVTVVKVGNEHYIISNGRVNYTVHKNLLDIARQAVAPEDVIAWYAYQGWEEIDRWE